MRYASTESGVNAEDWDELATLSPAIDPTNQDTAIVLSEMASYLQLIFNEGRTVSQNQTILVIFHM